MPYGPTYTMAKAAVRGLGGSLRQGSCASSGARGECRTVLPGLIDTPFFRNAANATGGRLRPIPPVYPAETVAKTILAVLRRPRREVYAGHVGRTIMAGSTLAPRVTERVMALVVDRVQVSRHETPATRGALHSPGDGPRAVGGGFHGRARQKLRRAAFVGAAALAVRRRLSSEGPRLGYTLTRPSCRSTTRSARATSAGRAW